MLSFSSANNAVEDVEAYRRCFESQRNYNVYCDHYDYLLALTLSPKAFGSLVLASVPFIPKSTAKNSHLLYDLIKRAGRDKQFLFFYFLFFLFTKIIVSYVSLYFYFYLKN
jgi:hypothetical protein